MLETKLALRYMSHICCGVIPPVVLLFLAVDADVLSAQISPRAYRALGQPDLSRNGLNRLQGNELFSPGGMAVDNRNGPARLYISDSGNHRVLGWPDALSYQQGDAPAIVLGQYSPEGSGPMGIGETGFLSPSGLAVSPVTGDLYVADTGNNRVLRFPDPFGGPPRIDPDAVYGQSSFAGRAANASGNPRNSLRAPAALAFDAAGNLWIADQGNHRVLRYSAVLLNAVSPAADLVIGQKDFDSFGRNRGSTLITTAGTDSPSGLAFDAEGNLYVSDTNNFRILRFTPPFAAESAASAVFEISAPNRLTSLPAGVTISDRRMYVAVPKEHRVLVFSIAEKGSVIISVLGQADLSGRDPNAGVYPRAAAHTLAEPGDVKSDRQGNVYVADTGNHRALRFPRDSRSADRAWGQPELLSNGANQVKASGLSKPWKIVVDYTREPFALYASDTMNNRVLVWRDAVRFRTGDPADAVIGQNDLYSGSANASGVNRKPSATSLNAPKGIALDPWGNLYVADSGNNRVLRFSRPLDQAGTIAADLAIGQPDVASSGAGAPGPATLRSPSAVALASDGSLFVSDTGNNRVMEFAPVAVSGASAIRVYGQPGFSSATLPRAVSAQTLNQPSGLAVDAAFNLYVADTGSHRVLIYANTRDAAPASNSASMAIGTDAFDRAVSGSGRQRLNGPADVSLDSQGRVYVSDARNNRVLVFPSVIFIPITDAEASAVLGQNDFSGVTANWSSRDASAPDGLAEPAGIFVDRRDTLYVADSANHRVLHFLRASRVVHGAFRQASAVSPGAIVKIEGEALAGMEATAAPPLPNTLADREVVVDDTLRAPLLSVAPGGMTIQLPSASGVGAPRIAVRAAETHELIAGGTVAVAAYAPGLFSRVLNQDGAVNGESAAAVKGSTLRIYGTGQGPVSPLPADGEAAPDRSVMTVAVPTTDGTTCLTQQPSVCVAIGNTFGEVRFSGLAAGEVGTWQLDVRVPENAPSGSATPLRAVINGVPTNVITIAVR